MIDNGVNWGCPGAVALLTADQTGGGQWLTLRREGVGASELAALMGEGGGPEDNSYTLWLDKTGVLADDRHSMPMEWGLRSEDAAARWFADQTGLTLRRQGLLRSRDAELMQATVDRLSADGGVLQVKVSETGAAYRIAKQLRRGELPRYWYWQGVGELFVTGRSHWWLAAVVGGELFIERLFYSDVAADITRAVDAVYQFWFDHVEGGAPPARPPGLELVDGGLVIDADPELVALLQRWAQAKRAGADNEVYLDNLRGLVLEAMGRAAVVRVDGRPFARRHVVHADRVDVTRLRREDPDTAQRFLTTGAHQRLELLNNY